MFWTGVWTDRFAQLCGGKKTGYDHQFCGKGAAGSNVRNQGRHQGVIAHVAAWDYATLDEILESARQKGEDPFLFLLDNVEDPHNLGAIIRTANLAGAHGVVIPKRRAGRIDIRGSKGVSGRFGLYTGGKGDESESDHRSIENGGNVVRLRRYGRNIDV